MARDLKSLDHPTLDRRAFHKLPSAAFGGIIAGAMAGCKRDMPKPPPGTKSDGANDSKDENEIQFASLLLEEPHVCRGLNTCKGMGKGGDNDCAGQGTCASVAGHICATHNDCKGQGGCGQNPGENACSGKGGCAVPMKGKMWEKARANFEAAMTKAGKKFGDAPGIEQE